MNPLELTISSPFVGRFVRHAGLRENGGHKPRWCLLYRRRVAAQVADVLPVERAKICVQPASRKYYSHRYSSTTTTVTRSPGRKPRITKCKRCSAFLWHLYLFHEVDRPRPGAMVEPHIVGQP
jgi:hypothetical protein